MKKKHYYLFEMKTITLNIISILLLIIMLIITYYLRKFDLLFENYALILMLIVPYFILHELLHSIAYVIHGADFKNITYGAHIEKGILCCLCKQNISKRCILTSLVYPLIFLGIIVYLIGILTNCGLLVVLSIMNISGCAGDIMMFIGLSTIKNFEYSEYDNPMAFGIYTKEDFSKKKMLGLKYIETKDSLEKKDMKKVTISKVSWLYFIFMILMGIVFMVI